MDENQTLEERAKYVEGWNTTMTQIWQERIQKLGIYETPRRRNRMDEPHLYDSLRYFPVKHDGKYLELTLHFTFPEYGVFQDLGTGREKYRGNPGDIGEETKSGRERKFRVARPWFTKRWYSSILNIKDFMARSIGKDFVGMVATTFENMNNYK